MLRYNFTREMILETFPITAAIIVFIGDGMMESLNQLLIGLYFSFYVNQTGIDYLIVINVSMSIISLFYKINVIIYNCYNYYCSNKVGTSPSSIMIGKGERKVKQDDKHKPRPTSDPSLSSLTINTKMKTEIVNPLHEREAKVKDILSNIACDKYINLFIDQGHLFI